MKHCKLLHKDICPSNIFIIVDAATPENAVPENQGVDHQRKHQLGNWGLLAAAWLSDGASYEQSSKQRIVP